MAVNANKMIAKINKLDWVVCVVLAAAAVGLLIAGQTTHAGFAALSAAVSGAVAWLNPGKGLTRLLERKMFRKRPAR